MVDHVGFTVENWDAARLFYVAALAPLGMAVVMEWGESAGFGVAHKPEFWVGRGPRMTPGMHIAFRAKDRATVDAFYAAAMAAGGVDNGPPGLRPQYHAAYYGAFVRDPDGHNIEAVCHDAP